MQILRPEYDHLMEALDKADADLVAAESHGVLCGILSASGKAELGLWLDQIFENYDVTDSLVKDVSQLLVGLHESTKQQLSHADVEFQLFLPDDNVSLAQRTEALALWCQGFTFGLAAGGIKKDQTLPPNTAELIHDMVEIARAGHDLGDDSETDEEAYMQIYEYVRMGVLLILEELNLVESDVPLH